MRDSFLLLSSIAARAGWKHVSEVLPGPLHHTSSCDKTVAYEKSCENRTRKMKRSGSTRVARKIGSYDDEESAASASSSQNEVQKPAG